MSTKTATYIDTARISRPTPVPIASERVITGEPIASTLVLEDTPFDQLGLWRVGPGEFVTDDARAIRVHSHCCGFRSAEYHAGVTIDLAPGATASMQPGWKGRWIVRETITKVFTVINSCNASCCTVRRGPGWSRPETP